MKREIHYLQDTLPTLGAAEVARARPSPPAPSRPDIEREFGRQYFVAIDLQKKSSSARPTSPCASRSPA